MVLFYNVNTYALTQRSQAVFKCILHKYKISKIEWRNQPFFSKCEFMERRASKFHSTFSLFILQTNIVYQDGTTDGNWL
jgi:hypothetical protein